MAAAYEAPYHIGQARMRGGLPSTDARFTDAKLLKLLSDELQGNVAPLVHNAKAEHGIISYSVTAVVGQSEYQLPFNAFASTLRDVYWIDSNNNITPLEPRSAADPLMYALSRNNGTPRYYYLRGARVNVVPPPGAAGTLAMPHYARPGILTNTYSQIATVTDLGSGLVNLAFGSASALFNFDPIAIVRGEPGFETIAENFSTAWNSTTDVTITLPSGVSASQIVTGDYVCSPGESPVPQVPVELFPLLHARAALVAVPSTGDMSQASGALSAQVADLEAKARSFLQPRVESGSPPPGKGLGTNPLLGVVSGSWNGIY